MMNSLISISSREMLQDNLKDKYSVLKMGDDINKKSKIINILHHQPLPVHFGNREELSKKMIFDFEQIDSNNWVGFFFGDHHATTALETLKRTDKYLIECWRPYNNKINRIYSKTIKGVVHRVFPCIMRKPLFWGETLWSEEMYEELLKESEKFNILLHLHDGHSKFIVKLLLKFQPKNIPVVYQHRSSKFSIFRYRLLPLYKKLNFANLIDFRRQKKILAYIDQYLSDSIYERRFLTLVLKFGRFTFYKQGINFNTFYPIDKSKINTIKRDLKLKSDSFVLLYVGRFYSEKDVDILIGVFSELKNQIKNLELLLVGGYKSDEYYNLAIQQGAKVFERVPENELVKFYQIANIYVMPIKNYTVHYFGGFGNAPIQALSTNVPIISDNLIHFLGNQKEKEKIGKMMISKEKLKSSIIEIYENPQRYQNCRTIVSKYYDINNTMKQLINIYDDLFHSYYS